MSTTLKLHELTGSPNSVKARVALGYKGLAYEREPIELQSYPGDRAAIAALSRQPRLPVLQHGKTVIFDSASILRYLEANFTDTPRIFRDDYQEHGEIDRWELHSRTRIGEPIGMMFGQAFEAAPDAEVVSRANAMFHDRIGAYEDKLSAGDFLVGDHLTAADIICASPLYLADMTEAGAEGHPIARFFKTHFTLGEGREKTRAWLRRVLAYDAVLGQR